jgi:predicted helicase
MRQLLSDIALIPDKDRRGKTFERAVKWLLENAPETRNQFKKVWLWDDYPDREGRDLGIDLVAETLQGTRWAIQAKCYGPDQSLTWGDLSTFYGDAIGRTEIDQLLLVTTTDPMILTGVVVALCAVGLVASYLPGRKASRLDLLEVLRGE